MTYCGVNSLTFAYNRNNSVIILKVFWIFAAFGQVRDHHLAAVPRGAVNGRRVRSTGTAHVSCAHVGLAFTSVAQKRELSRHLQNYQKEQALGLASALSLPYTHTYTYSPSDVLSSLQGLSLSQLQRHRDGLFEQIYATALAYGNVSAAEGLQCVEELVSQLLATPLAAVDSSSQLPTARFADPQMIKLPAGSDQLLQFLHPNEGEGNRVL